LAVKVLDSWALMALFNDEPAAAEVEKLLAKAEAGSHDLLMTVINWGEIYYSIMRGASQDLAEQHAHEIHAMPIDLVPVKEDLALVRQAAIFKALKKLPYADAFAAGLAKLRNAELVTGDRDFEAVEDEIRIAWLS
jgi:ribonuclease VapC